MGENGIALFHTSHFLLASLLLVLEPPTVLAIGIEHRVRLQTSKTKYEHEHEHCARGGSR